MDSLYFLQNWELLQAPSHLISLMKSESNKTLKASAFSPASVISFLALSIRDPCQATGEIIWQQSPKWTHSKILSDVGKVCNMRIGWNIDCFFQFIAFYFFSASHASSKRMKKEEKKFQTISSHLKSVSPFYHFNTDKWRFLKIWTLFTWLCLSWWLRGVVYKETHGLYWPRMFEAFYQRTMSERTSCG